MRREEGKGSRPPLAATTSSQGRQSAELDQPRLVLVQRQTEGGQSLSEGRQHLPCIIFPLEAHHEVVGVTHHDDPPARMAPAPLMDPEVEDVV